jgi:hypothetical protein
MPGTFALPVPLFYTLDEKTEDCILFKGVAVTNIEQKKRPAKTFFLSQGKGGWSISERFTDNKKSGRCPPVRLPALCCFSAGRVRQDCRAE